MFYSTTSTPNQESMMRRVIARARREAVRPEENAVSGTKLAKVAEELRYLCLSHSVNCERRLLREVPPVSDRVRSVKAMCKDDPDGWCEGIALFNQMSIRLQGNLLPDIIGHPDLQSKVEDLLLCVMAFASCSTLSGRCAVILQFVKNVCEAPWTVMKEIYSEISSLIFEPVSVQSGLESTTPFADEYNHWWKNFSNGEFLQAIVKVLMYLVSLQLFPKDGLWKKVTTFLSSYGCTSIFAAGDVIGSVLNIFEIIVTKFRQYMETGSLYEIFHSENEYKKWDAKTTEALFDYRCLQLRSRDIDKHGLLGRLRDLRDDGCLMADYVRRTTKAKHDDKSVIMLQRRILDLESAYADLCVKLDAHKPRKQPHALQILGKSSVGKSSFLRMVFAHAGYVLKKEKRGFEQMFTRNPQSEFWDGLDPRMWCIVVDDAAQHKSSKLTNVDPTLMELIQLINTIPYCPPFAGLEDKGKVPCEPDVVYVTTNVDDLNIPLNFSCPYAVARRMPYRITLEVKKEYRRPNSHALDGSKVDTTRAFLDIWDITVHEVVVDVNDDKKNCQNFVFKEIMTGAGKEGKWSMGPFLKWYGKTLLNHMENQELMVSSADRMTQAVYCDMCCLPEELCECITVSMQTGLTALADRTKGYAYGVFAAIVMDTMYRLFKGVVITEGDLLNAVALSVGNCLYDFIRHVLIHLAENAMMAGVLVWYVKDDIPDIAGQLMTMFLKECGLKGHEAMRSLKDWAVQKKDTGIEIVEDSISELGRLCETARSRWLYWVPLVAAISAAVAAWKVRRIFMQGQVESLGVRPASKNEYESVWKKEEYPLSSFDVPRATASFRGKSIDDDSLIKYISKRVAYCIFENKMSPGMGKNSKVMCLHGNAFLSCEHTIPILDDDSIMGRMVWEKNGQGVTVNRDIHIGRSNMINVGTDLCLFICEENQPRADVRDMVMPRVFMNQGPFDGILIGRTKDGEISTNKWYNIQLDTYSYNGEKPYKAWKCSQMERPTVDGDCGSVLVVMTGAGPMIAGIHRILVKSIFGGFTAYATSILREQLDDVYKQEGLSRLVSSGDVRMDSPSSNTGPLGPLHPKATCRWVSDGTAEVYGSFSGFQMDPRSKMHPSMFSDDLKDEGIVIDYHKPHMGGYMPKHLNFKKLATLNCKMNPEIVKVIRNALRERWSAALPMAKKEIMIYDFHTAVNGVKGLRFVDRIPISTSAGFPFSKSKKNFLICLDEDAGVEGPIDFDEEIKEWVDYTFECYERGEQSHFIFKHSSKDEVLPMRKIIARKLRGVNGASLPCTLVTRMLLLSFIRVVQMNKFIFEQAPGVEAQTSEWEDIYKYLAQMSEGKNAIFGDYSSYDATFVTSAFCAAFDLIIDFHKDVGANERHIRYLCCLKADVIYFMCNFHGDLVQFLGKNPTGVALTVIVNGIVNTIYMRYAWIMLHPAYAECAKLTYSERIEEYTRICREFDDKVRLITYGDDNGLTVDDGHDWFNHSSISAGMAQFGVTYTMADKCAESKPYIHVDEGSFLKRRWVYDAQFGGRVCPLDPSSIYKSLMWTRSGDVITPKATLAACCVSASYEWAWHGEERFKMETERIDRLCKKHGIDYVKKDFNFYVNAFKAASQRARLQSGVCELESPFDLLPALPVVTNYTPQNCYFFDVFCYVYPDIRFLWCFLQILVLYLLLCVALCVSMFWNIEKPKIVNTVSIVVVMVKFCVEFCCGVSAIPNIVNVLLVNTEWFLLFFLLMWRRVTSRWFKYC